MSVELLKQSQVEIPYFFEITRGIFHALLMGALVIGFIRIRKLTSDQRVLHWLLMAVFVVEAVSVTLWHLKTNNNFIYHFYTVVEFLLLGTLYSRHLGSVVKPVFIRSVMALFVVFAIFNSIFFQGLTQFNSNMTLAESLLLIAMAMVYFYKLLRDLAYRSLQQVPMFWINMSVLTYFSGALMLFHVVNELIPLPRAEREAIYGTHAIFNIAHYALYAIALYVKAEETIQKSVNSVNLNS